MNEPERFVIPGLPPTTNHGYGVAVRGGKAIMYKTAEAKAWQEAAILIINAGKKHQDWADRYIGVRLAFSCKNKQRDVDGGVKLALDALASGLGFNDKRVFMVIAGKALAQEESTEIEVWQIGGPDG